MSLDLKQIDTLEAFAIRLAGAAADMAVPIFRTTSLGQTSKDGHIQGFDPVTKADKGAEKAMRALINQAFPDHGIIGEEYGEEKTDAEFVWVLDPIDGTRAFISGLPVWTTLIGLRHLGRAILGVISQPILQEIYIGSPNGSRLITPSGEEPLRVRGCENLKSAVMATTDPYLFQGLEIKAVDNLRKAACLTRYGCDAYAFAQVAAGHLDGAFETGLKPWDIEAIIPVIINAGGFVANWAGDEVGAEAGQVIACGSQSVMDEALSHLSVAAN